MKIRLLAGLIGAGFAVPAMADSNVTLYGLLDAGLHISSNGEGRKTKLQSGIATGSHLGFKGIEDIGNGYKAIFKLEMRLEVDSGKNSTGFVSDNRGFYATKGMQALGPSLLPVIQGATNPATTVNTNSALFDRTALVGLMTPVGTVSAGRMYTPGYEVLIAADTFEEGTAGGIKGLVSGAAGSAMSMGVDIASPKALQYRVETQHGINGALMYGFKNAGYFGLYEKFLGGSISYKANGLDVGLGYNRGTDQNGNRSLVTTTAGGSYATGDFKFFGAYHAMKNDNSVISPVFIGVWDTNIAPSLAPLSPAIRGALRNVYVTNLTRNLTLDAANVSVGMHYRTGNGRIMASVTTVNDKTASNNDATQYAVGYDYNLSKRTDIYSVVALIKNQNDAQYAPGTAGAPGGFTSAAGKSGRAVQLGIRHRF